MRRLRIGSRLALSFAIILLLTFLGSMVGVWQFIQVCEQAQRLHQVNVEAIAVLQVNNNLLKLQDELQQLVQTQNAPHFSAEVVELRDGFIKDVEQAIEILANSPTKNQETRYTTQLRQLADIATLSSQIDLMIELAEAGDWLAVQLRLENQVRQVSLITQNMVAEIEAIVAEERELAMQNMEQAQEQAFMAIVITSLLTLLTAGALGFVVTRSIAQPLAHLDAGAKALARHEFDHRLTVTGDDELTNLSQVFNDAASQLAELYADMERIVQERTDELQRRILQLETSLAVGQRITSILDLDPLLNQVVELIKERYQYYFVGVFLLDESGAYVTARAGTGEAGYLLRQEGFRLKIGQEGIIGWVAEYHRPACVNDVFEDERYIHLDEVVPHTRSELALPLAMGKKMLGVLDIQSDQLMAFRLDDVPILQSLADQVAIAIQNASLYRGEQSRRQFTEALYRAGRAISSTLDLTEVLDLILEHLAKIVSYDRAAVLLQSGGELEFVAARGFPAEMHPLKLRITIKDNDVFQQIYQTKQPLVIPDVSQRPDWQQVAGLPLARAWLGAPLTRFDEVIGMLSLTREVPHAYEEEEVTLAATFAGQAAIALENARLYDKITRFTQQLEDMVRERTEAVQEAYSQLEHLDRTKSDFINIAAHELRTPLTVLRGYSKILLGDSKIKENAAHLQLVSGIHSGAIRLHEIVNSMLDITKIDNRALELYPEPLSIPAPIQLVSQEFTEALTERSQTLIIEDMNRLPAIEADPDALHKVFYHLIINAIKYTPDGGTITISGQARTNDPEGFPIKGIEIIVSDTGIGIDPQFQELIFTKFYQTGEMARHSTGRTKFKGAGPGLGLAVVRGIVEAHQGKVWVESPGYNEETCPGSQFYLFLPLRQRK